MLYFITSFWEYLFRISIKEKDIFHAASLNFCGAGMAIILII